VTSSVSMQGSRVYEIQQISNKRAPKWDQEGLSETTRKATLMRKDTRLPWQARSPEPSLQRRGRRFEPVTAHESNTQVRGCFLSMAGCEHTFSAARNPTKIQHPKSFPSASTIRVGTKSNRIQHWRHPTDPGLAHRPGPPVRYRRGSQVHRRGFGFVLGRSFGCVLGRGEAERVAGFARETPPALAGGVGAC